MRVLVTGGNGFLGTEICKQLLERGYTPISLSRSESSELKNLNVEQIKCDISKTDQLDAIDLTFDAVIHSASLVRMWGKWKDFYKINVTGTKNIINFCKKKSISYLIYTSTPSVVFNGDDIHEGDESLPYAKKSKGLYAKSKILAEKEVIKSNSSTLKTIAIRPHLIFGANDPHMIPKLVERAKLGRLRIIGDGRNKVDVIHVENAAHAHLCALDKLIHGEHPGGKAYFVAQETPVELWPFINTILQKHQVSPISKKVAFKNVYLVGNVFEKAYKLFGQYRTDPPMTRFVAQQLSHSHYFSHKNAKRDLGYTPRISIDQAIEGLGHHEH